ncbi:sigma-70 family RNA polymerase sigma factor [Streptomyces sp. NPDC018019]|uniref:sigma-70 family RNA polymerase sigma factor n=1 Tax=Streptomyces sp. NPDC018019 TaxID=3365030 RepID=UPI00379FEED3
MSSRSDHPTHATGAHQAHDDGRRRGRPRLPERYEPHLDGLFTYCLSVLCDHDAATAVLGEVLAVAERHHGRRPSDAALYRSWLYALARWGCLRRLADRWPDGADHGTGAGPGTGPGTGARGGSGAGADSGVPSGGGTPAPDAGPSSTAAGSPATAADPPAPGTDPSGTAPAASGAGTTFGTGASAALGAPAGSDGTPEAARRRRDLASLAWPEAAGTTPEQREALELAVRHRLSTEEVAAVLGGDLAATRTLLAAASCEVERTRAALAVVEFGRCPDVAQLAGDSQMLLGAALRRELVRHVDDCAECRRTAERATAHGPWPGTAPLDHGALPLVGTPRTAVHTAMAAAQSSRSGRAEGVAGAGTSPRSGRTGRSGGVNGSPRYDRRGFPVRPKDPATRRRRARTRAVTTTVLATVLAAPVLALWAAYRGAPSAEAEGPAVAAGETAGAGTFDGDSYQNASSARTSAGPHLASASGLPAVSVQVVGADGMLLRPGEPDRSGTGPGRLTVTARPGGGGTAVTLTASGGAPVHWSARAGAPWLRPSATAGVLRPGESTTVVVTVDHGREPEGYWNARVTLAPGGTTVTLEGWGEGGGGHGPGPGKPPGDGPGPRPGTGPTSSAPEPTDRPTVPPTPSPTSPPATGGPTTGPSPSPSATGTAG